MTTTKKTIAKKRPKRIPVGGSRDILTVDGLPEGYVGRWVNDEDARIQKFLDGGYEFVQRNGEIAVGVTTVDSSEGSGSLYSKNVGNGIVAYLMAIPKEYYEEDAKERAKQVDKTEADMLRKLNNGDDGRYGEVTLR